MTEYLPPKNWPEKHLYSPESIGKEIHISLLRLATQSNHPKDCHKVTACIEEKRAHPHVEIRKLDASPHPLAFLKDSKGRDQYGLFAAKKIPKDSALGEFVGEVTLINLTEVKKQKKLTYNYIIPLKNQSFWCIDSEILANEMMYVNDYRGLKDAPNAHLAKMINRGFFYFGYVALRDIDQDEEIVVDYGVEVTCSI